VSQSSNRHTQGMLKKYNLHIKKKFGQNYLIDDNIIDKIITTSLADTNTHVIEVGPGLGSMTIKLSPVAKQILAYEIDQDLINPLKTVFSDYPNIKLIHDDILNRDIDNDISVFMDDVERVHVVANLPYYITTPILFKFLEESNKVERLTLMTQYEVAKRLTAKTGTKDYNALSVLMHYKTESVFNFKVPKSVFMPPPNVDSAVISLQIKKTRPKIDEPFFFDFIKEAFRQRRKTLINNLHAAYYIEKDVLRTILKEFNINENTRAEALEVATFITLSEYIRENFF